GRLLPEVLDVLDVAAKYRLAVGTGHLGAEEGMPLVREGLRRGCRMVLTHCDNPANFYSAEQQAEAARLGAVVEHSFLTTLWNRTPAETIAAMVRAAGCENVILTTDFGQPASPFFDEGMDMSVRAMEEQGFSQNEIDLMVRKNPARLIAAD
ncbi:MAG: amidohydrolase, partial [Lachnospiraceae bacterium]|nr:amidohydrolase [Lachnospiraceae bacterium]